MLYLYGKHASDFTTNGDPIRHSYDEHVVRYEGFYLSFKLLLDKEEQYKTIHKEMIISALTPEGRNQFRVYDTWKRDTYLEIMAVQLMYDFDNKQVNPFKLKKANGKQVIQSFQNSFKSSLGTFTLDSPVTELHDFSTNDEDDNTLNHNALEILNRITKRWDSELMLNGFDIRMIKRLGEKTDALLYEKKNISEFEDESTMRGMATRIHATSTFRAEGREEDTTISVTVDSPLLDEYAQVYEKSYMNNDCHTEAELIDWVKLKYNTQNIDKPKRTIRVSTNIIDGTEINYGDDLVLKYLVHDVDEIIRCVGYDYDPIRATYYSVTLGDWKDSFLNTITGSIIDTTDKELEQIKNNIAYVGMAANGKNRNAWGPHPVPNPINGDQWFYFEWERPNEIELRIYQDGEWIPIRFASKQEVEQAQATADQAKQDAIKAHDDAVLEAERLVSEQKVIFEGSLNAQQEEINGISKKADETQAEIENAITSSGFKDLTEGLVSVKENSTKATQALSQAESAFLGTEAAQGDANRAITNAQLALKSFESLDGRNLYLESTELKNRVINVEGILVTNDFYNTSDYIRVYAGETYVFQDYSGVLDAFRISSYDAYTSDFIERVSISKDGGTYTVPSGVSHIRASISSKGPSKIEKGTVPSGYTQAPEDIKVSITNINGELAQKVSQSVFDTLNSRVSTHDTSITQNKNQIALKANQTEVDTLSGTVATNKTSISTNASAIKLKASQSFVDLLNGKVDSNTATLNVQSDAIALKASQTSVNTVDKKVSTNAAQILLNTNAITSKVSSVDVEDILTGKQYVNETKLTQTANGFTTSITQLSSKVDSLDARNLYVDSTEQVGRVLDSTGGTELNSFYSTSNFIRVYAGETYTFQVHSGSLDTFRVSQYDLNTSTDFKRRVGVSVNDGKLVIPSDVTHIRVSKQSGSKVKVERSSVLSEWTPAPEDVTTLDKYTTIVATIDGMQTTVANKAEQSQVTQLANAIQNKVTSEQMETRFTQTANSFNLRINSLDKRNLYITSTETKDFVLSSDGTLSAFTGYGTSHYIRVYAGETVCFKDHEGSLDTFRVGLYDLSTSVVFIERKLISKSVGKLVVPSGVTHIRVSRLLRGNVKVENNDTWTEWTPAPEDVADKNTLIAQINLSEEGALVQGKKIILDGDVQMTNAYVNKLNVNTLSAITANITSIRSQVLVTNSVTSTHVKADSAMIDNLFATTALVEQLTAKTAFINSIKAIDISADRITTGTLNASNVNIINLNVSKLVGNTSDFVKSSWNGISTQVQIDSTGITATDSSGITASMTSGGEFISRAGGMDGSQSYMRNGRLYFRDTDGVATLNVGAHPIVGEGKQRGSIAVARAEKLFIGRFSDYLISNPNASVNPYISLEYKGTTQGDESLGYVKVHKDLSMNGKAITDVQDVSGYENSVWSTYGRLSLGASNPSTGNIYKTLQVGYANTRSYGNIEMMPGYKVTESSDRRWKNILQTTTTQGLKEINKLTLVDFTWKNGVGGVQLGLIAQDSPFLAVVGEDGYYGLDGMKHRMLNTLGIQELDSKVNCVHTFVNQHELEIKNLKKRITELEELVA
ncbi:tail fiber domain-containing protein [Jeotgalibaca sp. MA1X17-3]|uniref:tail fiber domain-containing protein n=1 Tax=Jeotgalibaca sp. MA1X17-3 TaxID=2908211 RepID=UPI001F1E339C|nr:tail fiber domain-containing protein [Jeotgalibaca sp. MA1X17-3]UJF15056.1 tail fiber domain-containing protein [Jeotgalibaca sp. MA1X17-3]